MHRRQIATLVIGGVAIFVVAFLAGSLPFPSPGPSPPSTPTPSPTNASQSPGAGQLPRVPVFHLFVLTVGILIVGALIAIYRVIGRPSNPTVGTVDESTDSVDTGETALGAVAETAGHIADQLEQSSSVDLQNEVYRSWCEMTTSLAVPNRDARTPGEFANAAIREGMAEDHVHALTHLFEDVRYGEEMPTEVNEQRAIDLLREIEATYQENE